MPEGGKPEAAPEVATFFDRFIRDLNNAAEGIEDVRVPTRIATKLLAWVEAKQMEVLMALPAAAGNPVLYTQLTGRHEAFDEMGSILVGLIQKEKARRAEEGNSGN